jgi:hypothetical protein
VIASRTLDGGSENASGSPRNAVGEVRSTTARRSRQDRGWTPQALALGLARAGLPGSKSTILRSCNAGEIPHRKTAGGHIRIDPAWVAETFPSIEACSAEADAA